MQMSGQVWKIARQEPVSAISKKYARGQAANPLRRRHRLRRPLPVAGAPDAELFHPMAKCGGLESQANCGAVLPFDDPIDFA
jgi:hypothetical protein